MTIVLVPGAGARAGNGSYAMVLLPSVVEPGGSFDIALTRWQCSFGGDSFATVSVTLTGPADDATPSVIATFTPTPETGDATIPQQAPTQPGTYIVEAFAVLDGQRCGGEARQTLTVTSPAQTTPDSVPEAAPSSAPTTPPSLPRTGSASLTAALAAFAVLLLGGGLTLAARRR